MNTMNIRRKWITGIFVLAISLSLIACNDFGNSPSGSGMAKVNQVEVVTAPGNPPKYAAVAAGILPDGCTTLGRASQRVVATTIKVTLPTQSTQSTCSQLATVPFEETIPLNVTGLSAGSYSADVNGVVASFILTEDH
jgi:inhibitor of cysteine peptidase